MSRFNTLLVLGFLVNTDFTAAYLESVATSVIGGNANNEPFMAMVAFQCGYRNRYYSKEGGGSWITDSDPNAGCLTGKLDILKYCRKVYPGMRITNIVESTHEYELPSWCKLEGHPCKWTHKVKPYRCVVGNFESEALLVPEHCHFGHVDDQKLCNDFDYWNRTAQNECVKRGHSVKSFAMLEPCGLDMFSGVEYVCCPKDLADTRSGLRDPEQPTIDLKVKVKVGDEQKKTQPVDTDDDDSSDDDDDDDDDDEDSTETPKKPNSTASSVKKRILTSTAPSTTQSTVVKEVQTEGGSDDDDDDEDSEEKASTEDPYFRKADPDHEYVIYRSAIDRLEKKHREKVAAALRKLSDAESKYRQNNEHDETKVEEMKAEFKATMTALEKEHHEERHRVEQVHEQRVTTTLNERKRQALKMYRQAMKTSNGRTPQVPKVLRALQAYIRAEEKDRMHGLSRYRYLLRADGDEAAGMKEGLIKKLHDIDLRINGTIEMTRDVPGLMEKVKPAILEFWQTFRDENTPGRVDESFTWIGDHRNGEKLLEFYKKTFEYNFQKEKQQNQHQHPHHKESKPEKESDIRTPLAPPAIVVGQKWDHHQEIKHAHAFSLKESFQHAAAVKEEVMPSSDDRHHYGYVVLAVAGVSLAVAMTMGVLVFRRRCSLHAQGFMAVDAMTPEERHVSGMQVNGYENPTYKYFDAKPA